MWCGDVDTPPGYSLALRGHVGGSGQGTGRCGAAQCYYRDDRIWRGISTSPKPHTTHKRRKETHLRFPSRYDLTNQILQTTNLFLRLWFATRKTALAPKARNTPTPPANAAPGMTTPMPLTPAPPFAPHAGISVTATRSAARAANL